MKEKKIKLNAAQSKFFIESLLPDLIKIAKAKKLNKPA